MSNSSVGTLCSFGGGLRTSRGGRKGSCGGVSSGNASPMCCLMEESEKPLVFSICTSSGRLQPRSRFSFNQARQLASRARSRVMRGLWHTVQRGEAVQDVILGRLSVSRVYEGDAV